MIIVVMIIIARSEDCVKRGLVKEGQDPTVYIDMCIYIYIYIHVCIHIYIHISIYVLICIIRTLADDVYYDI